MNFNFFSRSLQNNTSVNVILPEPFPVSDDEEQYLQRVVPSAGFPTLYLLHGLSGDQMDWVRKTSIERYAQNYGLAIVMPNASYSFYTDMACGPNYWTYISEELPQVCRSYLPLSDRREDNFVAGNSMGGYGSFKWAMRRPRFFSAAASLSGALDMASLVADTEDDQEKERLEWIFGELDTIRGSQQDLLRLATQLSKSDITPPRLFQCCGTDDFLYQLNLDFRDQVEDLELNLTYEEQPGTAHEWSYWDEQIERILTWLPMESEDFD